MGVPTSGELSMQKLAREAKHGDYNGSQNMGTISMYDVMNGGQVNGSTISYPTVNEACTPNPIANGSDGEFTGIYVPNTTPSQTQTFYFNNSQAATLQDLAVGDTLYTNPALTTTVPQRTGELYWTQAGNSTCSSWCQQTGNDATAFQTNASGEITYIECAAF